MKKEELLNVIKENERNDYFLRLKKIGEEYEFSYWSVEKTLNLIWNCILEENPLKSNERPSYLTLEYLLPLTNYDIMEELEKSLYHFTDESDWDEFVIETGFRTEEFFQFERNKKIDSII